MPANMSSKYRREFEVVAMLVAMISGLILGAALALRFKAFVLIPVIVCGFVLVGIAGIVQATNVWASVAAMVTASVSLQLGYLGAAAALSFFVLDRRVKGKHVSAANQRSQRHNHNPRFVSKIAARALRVSDPREGLVPDSPLGEHLRWYYRAVVREPVPPHLMALVHRL